MKKTNLLAKITQLSFAAFLIINIITPFSLTSHAEEYEDPGAGRLSGKNIPKEFFEDAGENSSIYNGSFIFNPFNSYGSVTTANTFTGKNYTHQDKFDGYTIINGIDVSSYQKQIDWAQVKASGIDFAFIRTGGRYYGINSKGFYADANYDINMTGAAAAGIKTGIYFFSQAITPEEAVEEADYILGKIGSYTVSLPLILDFEFASNTSGGNTGRLYAANLSKDAATDVCLAFCKRIQEAGYTPMVYANPDMLNNHLNPAKISESYPIWLANYITETKYSGMFSYWQYSSSGQVPGIEGNVDMNYYYEAPTGSMASAIISPINDQTYTGTAITPQITVTIDGKALINGTDYTLTYANNTNVGTASITVNGINAYNGTRQITFNIIDTTPIPVVSDLSEADKTKNSITLEWTEAANITGYELYRANSLNGEYALIGTVGSANTTSFKNSSLAEGQCYYYKIRAYRSTNGENTYGDFSQAVALYTKTSYTKLILPTSNTDIYAGMDMNSEVIQTVKKNTFVKATFQIYNDAGTKWFRTSYKGKAGYIPASKVKAVKQGKVNTSKVNVRKKSKVTSKKVTTVGKNKKVAILKTKKTKNGTWYNITFTKGSKTYKGWIYSIYVKI